MKELPLIVITLTLCTFIMQSSTNKFIPENNIVRYDSINNTFNITNYVNSKSRPLKEKSYTLPLLNIPDIYSISTTSEFSLGNVINHLSCLERPEMYVWEIKEHHGTCYFSIYDWGFFVNDEYQDSYGAFIINNKAFVVRIDTPKHEKVFFESLFTKTEDSLHIRLDYEYIDNYYYSIIDITTIIEGIVDSTLFIPYIVNYENERVYYLPDSLSY